MNNKYENCFNVSRTFGSYSFEAKSVSSFGSAGGTIDIQTVAFNTGLKLKLTNCTF